MYDRAPRVLSRPYGSTTPGVGPGTYHTSRKSNGESYAPFLSMSIRESFLTVNESLAAAPGPGHYAPGFAFQKTKGGGKFNNKVERFPTPPSKAPGPGAYDVSKRTDWIRKTYPLPARRPTTSRNSTKIGHVTYHRLPTAPSIPMPGQNYGYDEDMDGVLKPQKLPAQDSTIGPAYYNVIHEDTYTARKYKGAHFGKYKSLRTKFKGRDGPGPSDYDPFSHTPNSSKQSSENQGSQASQGYLLRYHELVAHIEQKKAVPGPGQYEVKSQFERKPSDEGDQDADHPTSKVPFGSRLERFLTPAHTSPACTTYEDPRTALETTKRIGLGKAPFGLTSARFREDRLAKMLPGPGTYNDNQVTSLSTELTKKAMLQGIYKHPFSSTSVRTAPLVKRDELDMPGPADYRNDNEAISGSHPEENYNRPPKCSHMFSSTTGRLYTPPKIVTDIPPPGSYDVYESHSKTQGKTESSNSGTSQSIFLSCAERFAPPGDILLEEPDASNPGPGEYESPAFIGKAKAGVMCSKEERFKPIKSSIPGPGAYLMRKSQRDTLLQGTFNATLDNPLSKDQTTAEKSPASKTRTVFDIGV